MNETYEVKKCVCPYCGFVLSEATDLMTEPRPPQVGDVTVCIECLNVLMFAENLTFAKPDEETFAALRRNIGMWNYIELVRDKIRFVKSFKHE